MVQKSIKKPYTQIPLFCFLKMDPILTLKRKIRMHQLLLARKLFGLAPDWLYVNHNLMLALLIKNPTMVRYTFVDATTLATFMGSARYF